MVMLKAWYPKKSTTIFLSICLTAFLPLYYLQNRPILCLQDVRTTQAPPDSSNESNAYVFYATNDMYACSALVNIARLQDEFSTKIQIVMLVSSGVTESFLSKLHARNVTTVLHDVPHLAEGGVGYYEDVLLKCVTFKLHMLVPNLERILVLDSDQLILQPLDHLFAMIDVDLAAPRAYWISHETFSSTFMLIRLSPRVWSRVEAGLDGIGSDTYDMDLLNRIFANEVMLLPGWFVTLNSHWEVNGIPDWYTGVFATNTPDAQNSTISTMPLKEDDPNHNVTRTLEYIYETQATVMHFFAVGKPWDHSPAEVLESRPEAHHLLSKQFGIWRDTARRVCQIELDPNI